MCICIPYRVSLEYLHTSISLLPSCVVDTAKVTPCCSWPKICSNHKPTQTKAALSLHRRQKSWVHILVIEKAHAKLNYTLTKPSPFKTGK